MAVIPSKVKSYPFVLLRAIWADAIACKTYVNDGNGGIVKIEKYKLGKKYTYETVDVASVYDVGNTIINHATDIKVVNIRGKLREGVDPNGIVYRRKSTDAGYPDETLCFEEDPNGAPFINLDIDKVKTPEHLNFLQDPVSCVKYVISLLPNYLQSATCFYQLSNSAGAEAGAYIKVHLWYWITNPLTDSKLAVWAKSFEKLIDPSPLRTVQPSFIANPNLIDVDDPFPTLRFGFIAGVEDAVTFPDVIVPQLDDDELPTGKTSPTTGDSSTYQGCNYLQMLGLFGDGEGCGGFHNHVYYTAWQYFYETDSEDESTVSAEIKQAMLAAYADPALHSASYIKLQATAHYLKPQITNAKKSVKAYKAKKAEKLQILNNTPPYHDLSTHLDPEVAEKKLVTSIHAFFDQDEPENKVIKGGAGLGKSAKTMSKIVQMVELGYRVEVYVPSHKLAGELYEKLGKNLADANAKHKSLQIIRGRQMPDPDFIDITMCIKNDIVKTLTDKNRGVFSTMCMKKVPCTELDLKKQLVLVDCGQLDKVINTKVQKCENWDTCSYIKQFMGDWGVRILPHSYLGMDRTMLDRERPDFVVIDESFVATLLNCLGEQEEVITFNDIKASGWDGVFVKALTEIKVDVSLHKQLRHQFGDDFEVILDESAEITHEKLKDFSTLVGLPYSKQYEKAKVMAKRVKLDKFLEILIMGLDAGLEDSRGIAITETGFRMFYRTDFRRILGIPTLIIDADANEEIISQFLDDFDFQEIPVKRNGRFIQVYNTRNSYYSLKEPKQGKEKIADLQHLINRTTASGSSMVVIGPQIVTGNPKPEKFVAPLLTVPENSSLEHYGAIRGIDTHKDKDVGLFISRNQPPIAAMENMARALYYDKPIPLTLGVEDFDLEVRGISTITGFTRGIEVQVHPDQRVQQLMELHRECETMQSIDRMRLVWGVKRDIYITSNVVLPIPLSHSLTFKECCQGTTKALEAMKQCDWVLPLNREWLKNAMPYLFSEHVAKEFVKTYRNNPVELVNDLFTKRDYKYRIYEYKLNKKAAQTTICVSRYDEQETKDRLEVLLEGNVAYFKLAKVLTNAGLSV